MVEWFRDKGTEVDVCLPAEELFDEGNIVSGEIKVVFGYALKIMDALFSD